MAKRKKRNLITLVSLLLALVLIIGGYVWYINRDTDTSEEEEGTEEITLATIDPGQITTIHYKAKDVDLTLVLEEEKWINREEPDRPINQNNVKSMVNIMKEVSASRLVNQAPEDLAEYGLLEPPIMVEVTKSDGQTVKLQIGKEAITGDGYYARINEDKTVYLLDTTYGTGLSYSNEGMTAMEDAPEITADNIRHIEVTNRDHEDFELLYRDDNSLDHTGSNTYPWVILKPYEEGYSADSTKVNELLNNYVSYDFVTCVDYKGENLGLYGLDDPMASIRIVYNEPSTDTPEEAETDSDTDEETTYGEKEFQLHIGNRNEDGSYYYVKKEGSNSIYTMKSSDVEKLLQVNAFDLLNKFIAIPNIESVDQINIEINGTAYHMELKRNKTKNEDGEEETKTTYYYNGEEVDEDLFKDIYQVMINARYDAESKEEIITEGMKPYLTIRYQFNGENTSTVFTSYLPYNDSFYAVDIGNKVQFYADKRKIEEIAKVIIDFGKDK